MKLHHRLLFIITASVAWPHVCCAQVIDRKTVVQRHNVIVRSTDSLESLTVGNGDFAFTVDATGLQSFPEAYANGIPLGTESVWGWHSFPNNDNVTIEQAQKTYELNGRKISYTVQSKEPGAKKAVDYFRINPHRLQLGNIGLEIKKKDGSLAVVTDIKNIYQKLDLWKGEIDSRFTVEGESVRVSTVCDNELAAVSVIIRSPLIKKGRLKIRFRYPYPSGEWKDAGNNFKDDAKHTSFIDRSVDGGVRVLHTIDTASYCTWIIWGQNGNFEQKQDHYYLLTPDKNQSGFRFSFQFTPLKDSFAVNELATNAAILNSSSQGWKKFWLSGGAVDFSQVKDPRAFEIERRVILSQYLTRVQCASGYPPQETGLTYNSWYGKPHLEMHWWHAVHYALWGRVELMEKSLDWYFRVADKALAIAKRQGFDGLRWQKMTDNKGNESPSSVGAFLIWQQPHFIYMSELVYRSKPTMATLNKYKDLLFATADFMASFATYNPQTKKYDLGKGLIPAQECFDPVTTFNPTYELAYWSWALQTAQQWKQRLGLERDKKWDTIINNLAPLPQAAGLYLAAESTPGCYSDTSKYLVDHPAVLGAFSSLPAVHGLDTFVMKNTWDTVWKKWHWTATWGWDFPLTAMAAARLHMPGKAVDALLMPVRTNTYLNNGHNYQDDRLTIYLPGNGGVLIAVAMMCTGTDADTRINTGFPEGWNVKWEGLQKIF